MDISKRRVRCALSLAAVVALACMPRPAQGQAMLADDVIVLSKGQRARQAARTATPMTGRAPAFAASPGSTGPRLLPATAATSQPASRLEPPGVLSAASGYGTAFGGRAEPTAATGPAPLPVLNIPQYGTLELPGPEEEGPADGLTLDLAIDRLVRTNPDLASKARELPKARADVVTAGLIANPIVFASADNVPYGSYAPRRPGSNGYGIVLIQPLDVNGKRRARVIVAEQARMVTEALYADAVRLAIDRLATAFVDVLEARETIRYKQANVKRLEEITRATETMLRHAERPRPDVDRIAILRDSGRVDLDAARSALTQANRLLAVELGMPPEEADTLAVRGTIRDTVPPPPPLDDLIGLALTNRPDLVAYRLGVCRARAELELTRRERFEDVFLFYTPYGFQNYAYEHDKSATSWSLGGMVSIPLFNRNQGNINRASHAIVQAQIELSGLERQVVADVRRAELDYRTTAGAVERLEKDVLPRARRMRDDSYQLYVTGEQDVTYFFNADRDYNEVIRQYRDLLIRHRRGMLRLNTAVGQRILP